jgi:hypothetical protein
LAGQGTEESIVYGFATQWAPDTEGYGLKKIRSAHTAVRYGQPGKQHEGDRRPKMTNTFKGRLKAIPDIDIPTGIL